MCQICFYHESNFRSKKKVKSSKTSSSWFKNSIISDARKYRYEIPHSVPVCIRCVGTLTAHKPLKLWLLYIDDWHIPAECCELRISCRSGQNVSKKLHHHVLSCCNGLEFHSATIVSENIPFHDVLQYDSVTITLEIIKTDGLLECRIIILLNVFRIYYFDNTKKEEFNNVNKQMNIIQLVHFHIRYILELIHCCFPDLLPMGGSIC